MEKSLVFPGCVYPQPGQKSTPLLPGNNTKTLKGITSDTVSGRQTTSVTIYFHFKLRSCRRSCFPKQFPRLRLRRFRYLQISEESKYISQKINFVDTNLIHRTNVFMLFFMFSVQSIQSLWVRNNSFCLLWLEMILKQISKWAGCYHS